MSDEIQVTGSVNLVEVVATLHTAVAEMGRLGEFVKEEGKENRERFDRLRADIASLDKAQSLTDKDLKVFVAKVSVVASTLTAGVIWALKSGLLAVLL